MNQLQPLEAPPRAPALLKAKLDPHHPSWVPLATPPEPLQVCPSPALPHALLHTLTSPRSVQTSARCVLGPALAAEPNSPHQFTPPFGSRLPKGWAGPRYSLAGRPSQMGLCPNP